jgi:O-antigen ligase
VTSNVDPFERHATGLTSAPASASDVVRDALSRPVLLALFLLCATQPYGLELGPLLIGPYRLVLLIMGPILAIQWLMGRFGRLVLPDFLILGYSLWILISLAANGQANRIPEWGASQVIDTFFAYLLGRAAIRNRQDFYFFTRVLLYILGFLLPFAILESTTGRVILIRLFDALPMVDTFGIVVGHHEPRLGLLRAQTSAAHPILYGILCAMAFSFGLLGLAHSPGRPSFVRRLMLSVGSYMGTFFSLSAGAVVAAGIQGLLMLYNWLLRNWRLRWYLLAAGFTLFYIVVAIVSIRPPALVLGRLVAFNPSTAWNRYMIWQFGSDEVMRNPIFGMGQFSDWQRAPWMPASIDNEWLLAAMRFGLVGIGLVMGAIAYTLFRLMRRDFSSNPEMGAIRDAFVFTLISLVIAYGTVAAWNIQWSLLLVILGGSAWIYTTAPAVGTGTETAPGHDDPDATSAPPRASRYSRTREPEAARDPRRSHEGPDGRTDADAPRYSRFPARPRDMPGDR